MEHMNYAQVLSGRILALRKEKGMTQEALAEQLGLSFQAVSKWENGQSCPDIALLPVLAEIFSVSVDYLFGRDDAAKKSEGPVVEPVFEYCHNLPWPDDQTLRGVVAWGHKILGYEKMRKKWFGFNAGEEEYSWLLRYSPLNVECGHNLQVEGDVQGDASAGLKIVCKNVGGNASAGTKIDCEDIGGSASAGIKIDCRDINGSADAGIKVSINK